ncbi:MAG: hypothetical protein IPK80_28545 [Nannocystis sp.]|nr:hypothetical protein [Nannocystis sp.]
MQGCFFSLGEAPSLLRVALLVAVGAVGCSGDEVGAWLSAGSGGETTTTGSSAAAGSEGSMSEGSGESSGETSSDATSWGTSEASTGAEPVCGDGIVQEGEACDEGAENGDDRGCTASCALNVCGDGLVHAGVEGCDEGEANAASGACTPLCALNVCGDGVLWEEVEACDEGAENGDDKGCTSSCALNVCGDGLVYEGVEECDDADPLFHGGGDGCSATCTREQVIFVTLEKWPGDLGGAAGADERCLAAASASIKLPWLNVNNTTFKAWIADPQCPMKQRLPHSDRPYVRLDTVVFAENWEALIGGIPQALEVFTEWGKSLPESSSRKVWSAVQAGGSLIPEALAMTCNFWTLGGDSFLARWGAQTWGHGVDALDERRQGRILGLPDAGTLVLRADLVRHAPRILRARVLRAALMRRACCC